MGSGVAAPRSSLGEIAALFLRIGATAFGGPAAHIAVMEDECVRRRAWISREAFLDFVGAANLIPGPNSTELAMHIGHVRGGLAGLVVAGCSFILPAALMVTALAAVYVRFGALPAMASGLSAVAPVVVVVVASALWGLGRTAARTPRLALIGVACIALTIAGVHELAVLAAAAAAALFTARRPTGGGPGGATLPALFMAPVSATASFAAAAGLAPLFLSFLKIGSLLFGSGYVLLAFFRAEYVDRLHWITARQLADAVAVGQFTPGPLFTAATFVGYLMRGVPGAAVATVGIFLPAFLLVAASGVLLPRLRASAAARAALEGLAVASLALMVVVTVAMARDALTSWPRVAVAGVAAVALFRFRVNASWVMVVAAAVGVGVARLR